jgi:hypothetical protein
MSVDPEAIRFAIDARLPRRVRWMIKSTPLDFDFSAARQSLRRLAESDVVGGPIPHEWSECLVFGMYDYAEGGGASPWIAIRESDGAVCGLDIERQEEKTFIFNSSLDRFIRTFAMFDEYLRGSGELPSGFATHVRDLDPDVFPASDWRELIELITGT